MEKMGKIDIAGYSIAELADLVVELGQPKFRAKQLFNWIHRVNEFDPRKMTNIPASLSGLLLERFTIAQLHQEVCRTSEDGTEKYLFRLGDDQHIETVLIPEADRNTLCVSSQVGCAMGCTFCATGKGGLARNLTTAEIVGQVLKVQQYLGTERPITNVVFMGMGEPFANYPNLVKAIKLLNDPEGLNIGMRRITISTCGIVPKIIEFAKDLPQVGLAISLHAASDDKRAGVMPITRKYPLSQLMSACRRYAELTNRRITFEYALIGNFNDTSDDLDSLVRLLAGLPAHVNIIPVNPVDHKYKRPSKKQVTCFVESLVGRGIAASIRQERGLDIEAACGQLRAKVGSSDEHFRAD